MEKERLTGKPRNTRRRVGTAGEELAVRYLRKQGYEILQTNFRFEKAEIDVVAREGDALVFVEVKSRRSKSFGEPEEAVTPRKQQQLRKAAEGYLFENGIDDVECRFDVLAIYFYEGKASIDHIQHAF